MHIVVHGLAGTYICVHYVYVHLGSESFTCHRAANTVFLRLSFDSPFDDMAGQEALKAMLMTVDEDRDET